ncbi:hypothetical protein Y032_0434g1391 [Ancylostoma ceylanicum]|uniref:HAT C-terminal dimerisation domain-containing protein n=1 Tax=Ancylostoma ceylanicum TaxID=53326 RepID=A0A016X1V1_9BILA|nr:hypothetical protein Y032_0434g1391 [Ancylostoma ceylanicum]
MTESHVPLRRNAWKYLFYEVIDNTVDLLIPDEVKQAIGCVLVIPASNAAPERSFSAADGLAHQWMHPILSLEFSPRKPSTFEKGGSLMNDVETSLPTGAGAVD